MTRPRAEMRALACSTAARYGAPPASRGGGASTSSAGHRPRCRASTSTSTSTRAAASPSPSPSLSSSDAPPSRFLTFRVAKTLRVPVFEPRYIASARGNSPKSLERWTRTPRNVMGVVFTADDIAELREGTWRVQVTRMPLLQWELSPEFDLRVLPPEASTIPGGVRMQSDALRFADANSAERLPPGFKDMDLWTRIDATLYVDRDGGGGGGGDAAAVCADLDVQIAADIPSFLRLIPYFEKIGESAIGTSIDIVGAGARTRVQDAYVRWTTTTT